jgi:hypothetical protein
MCSNAKIIRPPSSHEMPMTGSARAGSSRYGVDEFDQQQTDDDGGQERDDDAEREMRAFGLVGKPMVTSQNLRQ